MLKSIFKPHLRLCKCGEIYSFWIYNPGMCIHCLRLRYKMRSIRRYKVALNIGNGRKIKSKGGTKWLTS